MTLINSNYYFMTTDQKVWGSNPYAVTKNQKSPATKVAGLFHFQAPEACFRAQGNGKAAEQR